jgi:transcriptional regulator with XRE-family HTH domain
MYDFSILRELRKRAGLNIADVSERSGVSAAVISKLERNQNVAELETLFKLARAFDMNPSDLLRLAESRSPHKRRASSHDAGGFRFRSVQYGNVSCLHGAAPAGSRLERPEVHHDDYEVCWVLKGKLAFYLPNESHTIAGGNAIQFDALLEHSYEALSECEMIIVHIRKDKRF